MSVTAHIILAVIDTGFILLGILVGQLVSLFRTQRQDIPALHQEVRADFAVFNSRIDALYQALFGHKDPSVCVSIRYWLHGVSVTELQGHLASGHPGKGLKKAAQMNGV